MAPSQHLRRQLLSFALVSCSAATFFYPNAQASLIEHILVDTHGAHSSGFADAITPCTNYVSGSQILGRETAAQWLRVSFHDFVTANVTAGTGGIDASIGFETLREENSGSAMNDSLSFFRPYVSAKISTADLIALSVTMSVGNCGGPQIPVRGGRIDATQGGGTGVPAPDTDLELTLLYFSRAGFNQVDAIALTACGHTIGNVHHVGHSILYVYQVSAHNLQGGFPTVVGIEAVNNETNTGGGIHFDSTVDVFDALVLTEYLNGTGNRGGPLVTSFNISSRSDLRLYESDNNTTMIKLAEQGQGFLNTCSNLLQRMIETVPKGVVLSDVIKPISLKPINTTLDFDASGNLIFTGSIRVSWVRFSPRIMLIAQTLTSLASAPSSIQLALPNSSPATLSPESAKGTSVFGSTTFFPFSLPVSDPAGFYTFAVKSSVSNSIFPVQTKSFVVPSLSSATITSTTVINFTVAVSGSSSTAPIVEIKAPVGQSGTLGPAIQKSSSVAVTQIGQKAGYQLWSGSLDLGTVATGPVQVAILGSKGQEIDIAFL